MNITCNRELSDKRSTGLNDAYEMGARRKRTSCHGKTVKTATYAISTAANSMSIGPATALHRHSHVLHDLTQHLIGLLRFLQRRSIASVDYHAMRKDRHRERLEVFGSAEAAAIQERQRLRRAIKRLRPAR